MYSFTKVMSAKKRRFSLEESERERDRDNGRHHWPWVIAICAKWKEVRKRREREKEREKKVDRQEGSDKCNEMKMKIRVTNTLIIWADLETISRVAMKRRNG